MNYGILEPEGISSKTLFTPSFMDKSSQVPTEWKILDQIHAANDEDTELELDLYLSNRIKIYDTAFHIVTALTNAT